MYAKCGAYLSKWLNIWVLESVFSPSLTVSRGEEAVSHSEYYAPKQISHPVDPGCGAAYIYIYTHTYISHKHVDGSPRTQGVFVGIV